ncbi:MAG TPA: sigma-70 family RNA polymerase sigma factor [Pirellulales bacterium]|nr:sigma-70 family RNA polymerase sigma factor [Pirellulales bacterium]
MPDEVRELVGRSLAGDQSAMAALVDRFRGQVFGLCYRILGHRQDAEDMAQESFVRALRNLASYDTHRDFRPWLLAIAGNRCRSFLATRGRRCVVLEADQIADDAPDEHAARNLAEEVELALRQIRPEYRQSFVLFHERQMSYAEIAEALECPVGTVKTWVHRARRELADHLLRRGVVRESSRAVRRV